MNPKLPGPLLRITSLVLALTTLSPAPPASADDDTLSYGNSTTVQTVHADWMKWVPDNTPLNIISLPGTHDTMSLYGGSIPETQDLELFEQLTSGIRALDIRVRRKDNRFRVVHGISDQKAWFEEVLLLCNVFLDNHPTETIILKVNDTGVPETNWSDFWSDYNPENSTLSKQQILNNYMAGIHGRRIWKPSGTSNKPNLGTVRGKIVLRGIYDYLDGWTDRSNNLWDLRGGRPNDYNIRWEDTQAFLELVDGDVSSFQKRETPTDTGTLVRVYDVTDHIFETGSNGSDDGGLVWPHNVAQTVNPQFLAYLFDRNQTRSTGITGMDYPGPALISAIIAHNMKDVNTPARIEMMADDFEEMWQNICHSADDGRESAEVRTRALKQWLDFILPAHHWAVVASEQTASQQWSAVAAGDGLIKVTDEIRGWKYLAVNALSLNSGVTTAELQAWMTEARLTSLSGTTFDRASSLRAQLKGRFSGVNWTVSVHRLGGGGDNHVRADASALYSAQVTDDGDIYHYTAWATSNYNLPPTVNAGGPYTGNEGTSVAFDASATTDPDNSVVDYFWDFNNDGVTEYNSTRPEAAYTYPQDGTYTARLSIFDGENTISQTRTVTIGNVAPVLHLGAEAEAVLLGETFTQTCSLDDPGADNWTVSVNYGDGSPVQHPAVVNKTFTLSRAYGTTGTRTVTVTVNDGTVSTTGTISITTSPGAAQELYSVAASPSVIVEGNVVTVTARYAPGAWNGQPSVAWGDGSANSSPTATNTGGGTYMWSVQHTYPDNPAAPATDYTVTANFPGWTSRTVPVTVRNAAPSFTSLSVPATVAQGATFTVGYTVLEPGSDTRTHTISWGDGSISSWVNGPSTSVSPPHHYLKPGTYTVNVTVKDDEQAFTTETRTITVTDAVPQVTDFYATTPPGNEGDTVSVQGIFSSPNLPNEPFSVVIHWGDGSPDSTASWSAVSPTQAMFNATHTFMDNNGANPWPLLVTVTDGDGSSATRTLSISVSNLPPVPEAGPDFSIPSGSRLTEFGSINDPGLDTFTGTVNYGDGTGPHALTVVANTFVYDHLYAADGVYTINVSVADDDGAVGTDAVKVLVGPVKSLLVTNTNDSGPGSLRQAVSEANTPSVDSGLFPGDYALISFAPALSGQTITLTSGSLVSSLRTRISATSLPAGITISGNGNSQIFSISSGSAMILEGLHLTGGAAGLGAGGAVFVSTGAELTADRCTVSNCSGYSGGGVFIQGGKARLTNCTFTGNSSIQTYADGGAIYVGTQMSPPATGSLTLIHCTVSGNSSQRSGGGLSIDPLALATITNSIVAGNSAVAGSPEILGVWTGTGNLTSGDPRLLPPGNYGGTVPTMPPSPDSPAIDNAPRISGDADSSDSPLLPLGQWRMGEDDASAVHGGLTALTAELYDRSPLTFTDTVAYNSAVSPIAAGWLDSRLGIRFPGTAGATGSIPGSLTDNFGIELWVKADSADGNQCLAYNGNSATSGWGLYQIGGYYSGLYGGVAVIGSAPVTAGVWTHLALVRSSGLTTFYVNGVAASISVATSTAVPNAPSGGFALGRTPQGVPADYFTGVIDEVRVFTFNPGQFTASALNYKPAPLNTTAAGQPTDQRGLLRVSNGVADSGAVEIEQAVVRLTDDSGAATLRQTIAGISPAGIITFAGTLAGKTITLASEISMTNKPLRVAGSGLSAGLTIDGGPGTNRLLSVAAGANLELLDLTLTGGNGTGTDSPALGGAVFNRGSLILDGCTLTANSTLYGAAIFNETGGRLTLQRSTVSGNQAGVEAGAIYHRGLALTLTDTTITGNTSAVSFGGLYCDNGIPSTVKNSIVAGNTGGSGADIENRGTLTRAGVNLFQSVLGAGVLSGPAHIIASPLLAPLGHYGGLTATRPPLPGSPVIDAGTVVTFTTDQRGAARVTGAAIDPGAVEAFPFSTIPLVDSDGDGADDRMELGYFGNLTTITPSSDYDHDGSPDSDELANMTSPLDSGDQLSIASFVRAPGFHPLSNPLFDVTIRTFPGLTYTIESSATLQSFTALPDTTFTATSRFSTVRILLAPGRDFLRATRQ